MPRIKPIVRWPGGKTRLLKHILPLFREHNLYVEAFGGGLAVMLGKERSRAEIVNDANGELVNLYRYAQFHLDALIQEVAFTLNSRANLAALVVQPGLTGLQRAARFLLRNRMSFGGNGRDFAVTRDASPSRENVLECLRALSARLDKVNVENLPYERLFRLYDRADTLWFLDPPYTAGRTDVYDVWTAETMAEFAGRVDQLQGDWIATVNDCPQNRRLFERHEIVPVTTASGTVSRKIRPAATFGELIVRRRLPRASPAFRPAQQRALKAAA